MSNDIDSIKKALDEELESLKKSNQQSTIIGGAVCLLVGGYLLMLNSQLSHFFEPEEVALAAAGAAVEAAPAVEESLRELLVEGAPDIARSMSTAVVDTIPSYRAAAEDELRPVIDEVTSILAVTAVNKMLESEAPAPVAAQMGTAAAADAVIERLDTMFEGAMNEPSDLDGPTPAQLIDQSVEKLQMVDRGLRRIARGGGDQAERELVLTLVAAIDAAQTEAAVAEADAYRAKGDDDAKEKAKAGDAEKAPAKPAAEAKPEGDAKSE